jgi:flagellar hook-associated protein 1 FlgK
MRGALDADQQALNVTANNVANANTTGYTREVPNWQENQPLEVGSILYGQGVTETGATSVRDRVLEARLDQQQQLASSSGARLTALNTLQALFGPDSGTASSTAGDIGSDITRFFDSFSSLEANPTNNALRQNVLSTASTMAGDISNAAASLNSQSAALDQEASGVTSQINSLTAAIAQLNQQIETTSPNADAGTLEDQRQQDLSQLSQLVGINQITTENNGLAITTTSGALLVSQETSYPMTTQMVNGVTNFFAGTQNITTQLASDGGSLGGYLTARDQDIPSVLNSLNQMAYNISTSVNQLNNTGTNLDGQTGTPAAPLYIFKQPTTVTIPPTVPPITTGAAAAMGVIMTDPNQISAAGLGYGTGDNSNATAMYNLSNQSIVSGQTPTDYYSNFVATLGSTVSNVQTENTAQNASVTQLQTQNNALSGVNLNDEASSLTTFERSYQAASEVYAILNGVMSSILNLGQQTTVS